MSNLRIDSSNYNIYGTTAQKEDQANPAQSLPSEEKERDAIAAKKGK